MHCADDIVVVCKGKPGHIAIADEVVNVGRTRAHRVRVLHPEGERWGPVGGDAAMYLDGVEYLERLHRATREVTDRSGGVAVLETRTGMTLDVAMEVATEGTACTIVLPYAAVPGWAFVWRLRRRCRRYLVFTPEVVVVRSRARARTRLERALNRAHARQRAAP